MPSLLFLSVATLVGATATFGAVVPYGVVIALLAAPFGGSASCVLAGGVLHALRSIQENRAAATRTEVAFQPR